jgi:TonB family protein
MTQPPAGHPSIRIQGLHPADVPFLFEQQSRRTGVSVLCSCASQLVIAAALVALSRHALPSRTAHPTEQSADNIVWLNQQGSGGGGGGGGNRMQESPRPAELPGKDKATIPVKEPREITERDPMEPTPPSIDEPIIPVLRLAAAENTMAGIIEPGPSSSSRGPGADGGAGAGARGGVGPDTGLGLRPGFERGIGGEAYAVGNGVTPPVDLYVPKPQYTPDAMRARIQGKVLIECVVETNGTCTKTRVVRSLDPTFGLDQEALKAAGMFRFRPGMRMGEPVAVLVTIELSFSLH